MVIYSMPPLLPLPFGFQPIYGSISDPKVKADFEALGADQAFWVNTMYQAFVNKAEIDELWENLQGQEICYVGKDIKIMESTPSVVARNITEDEFPQEVKMLLSRLEWKKKAYMPSNPSIPAPTVQAHVLPQQLAPQKIQYIIKQDDEEEKRDKAKMIN